MTILHVAMGGALGAVLRYLCALSFTFPYATLIVNVLGSLAMGVLWVWLSGKGMDRFQPLLMTGLLGGFTTFSAFSLDALRLIEDGGALPGMAYIFGTVALCLGAVMLGATLGRAIP